MAYSTPIFNLVFDWWNAGHTPAANAADITNVPCQYYVNSRAHYAEDSKLRFPVNLALVFNVPVFGTGGPIVEVVPGSGQYFKVYWVEWVHRGFPNEYWQADCVPCDNAGFVVISHLP